MTGLRKSYRLRERELSSVMELLSIPRKMMDYCCQGRREGVVYCFVYRVGWLKSSCVCVCFCPTNCSNFPCHSFFTVKIFPAEEHVECKYDQRPHGLEGNDSQDQRAWSACERLDWSLKDDTLDVTEK